MLNVDGQSRCTQSQDQTEACLHLFIVPNLLGDELIKHRAVILVDLLHLVDVAGHFLHGLQGLCGDENGGKERGKNSPQTKNTQVCPNKFSWLTCKVVVLLAVTVGEGHQFPEQQGVLEHPLHRFDQVGLQGGGVLLGVVPGIQEFLEGLIRLGCKTSAEPSTFVAAASPLKLWQQTRAGLHPEPGFW